MLTITKKTLGLRVELTNPLVSNETVVIDIPQGVTLAEALREYSAARYEESRIALQRRRLAEEAIEQLGLPTTETGE